MHALFSLIIFNYYRIFMLDIIIHKIFECTLQS